MTILGLELSGAGTHPAAWRRADSRAEQFFTAAYWLDAITAAEAAGIDFVFLPDSFALQAGGARGRLDAVAVAARAAAVTHRIGLVPEVPVTHTEPFHVSKAIASLDFATAGRAGWQVTVSPGGAQAALFGRKRAQDARSLWQEADEAAEVVARLWDSWEDDAEIRDLPTGRFIDRDKLHFVDFAGTHFTVKGPSITPRPPQGQPVVVVRADDEHSLAVAARRADVIRVAATDVLTRVHGAVVARGRDPERVRVLVDVETHLAATDDEAAADLDQLNRWTPTARNGLRHIGTAGGLRALIDELSAHADGVVVRPLAQAALVARLPELAPTLRTRLGLPRPANRYATSH